ncbi:DUF859 family phage minor structural protein [Priestia megaterium]|uniref:DUF859 family phage minor structural protein n=1 Tax=Priestia megaterium TaxID=1404 RepID=UPI003D2C3F2D
MSLSGSFYKTIASGYRLQLEWSATQDVSANTSTITAKLYWMSLSSAYTINSSTTKSGTLTIDGSDHDFSGAGLASLSGNQKKLISTYSKTVTHSSTGEKSVTLSGTFSPNVTLSGSYVGTQTISQTVTLNTIPRESSITSSLNWTAPNAFPISIQRASSSYTHTVRIYVNNTLIKTVTGIGTGVTVGWQDSENIAIFNQLAQTSSKPNRIELDTYNGSTKVGSTKTYTGTTFAEDPSTNVNSASFNIGDSVTASIARNNPNFTHKVKIYVNNTLIHTSPTFDYTYVWTPTSTELTNSYAQTPNSNSTSSKIEVITYFNGVQVDQSTSKTGTATVINSNPTFSTSYTYADTNATTKAITGNDQYIIQSKSTVVVSLPTSANATAINGASMVKYTATLNGVSKTVNYSSSSTITFDFGTVNASQNLTLYMKAIDSRGNSTTTTKTVTIIPYTTPSVSATAKRANGFEADTTISLSGSISALSVGGTTKNSVVAAEYRYKENISTASYPSAWTPFTYTTSGLTYTATPQTITLDQTKGYSFEIRTTDKLGTTTVTKIVSVGQPILFIDTDKSSVGIGMFPKFSGSLEANGDVYGKSFHAQNPANTSAEAHLSWLNNVPRIRYGGSGSGSVNGFQVHGPSDTVKLDVRHDGTTWSNRFETGGNIYIGSGGGIDLNNSDIIGVNSFWFNDTLDAGSEGINFLKTGKSSGSTNSSDYDTLQIVDGVIKLNGTNIFDFEVPPTVPSFQNGWVAYYSTRYMKTKDGMVFLQGMTKSGTRGQTAFVLPAGCRPTGNQIFYVGGYQGVMSRLDIFTDGTVVPHATEGTYDGWISLAGISFQGV